MPSRMSSGFGGLDVENMIHTSIAIDDDKDISWFTSLSMNDDINEGPCFISIDE